ncbi:phage tail tape measure C-terminal domain-containing protein, partial [Leclercia adecarboxylata]|uniref:phage tail tape measure C-terminal domain-containing protein n=1 Tax=Leclercia adecarboxylata TaxID=83655 RepID=UPI00234D1D58
ELSLQRNADQIDQMTFEEEKALLYAKTLDRLQLIKDGYAELRQAEGSWLSGAAAAWANYQQEASNYAQQMGSAVGGVIGGFEAALVKFTTTGKLSFSDLTRSVLADLARIAARQATMGIANAFASMWGGGAGAYTGNGTGAGSVGGFGNNLDNFRLGGSYSAGGYTGQGGMNEPAGVVHK